MAAKAIVCWSGGKDSAWALHEARRSGDFEVVAALTTIAVPQNRVMMHDVAERLLHAQWYAAGLRGIPVLLPTPCPNEIYDREMGRALAAAKAEGVTACIFGDLFLADIRAYREARIAAAGITAVFPLWGRPTAALANDMIAGGLDSVAVCVDLAALPAALAGRRFDRAFLQELADGVDPCGENGEFHTFVTAGPMLSRAIPVVAGPVTQRDGFARVDLTAI